MMMQTLFGNYFAAQDNKDRGSSIGYMYAVLGSHLYYTNVGPSQMPLRNLGFIVGQSSRVGDEICTTILGEVLDTKKENLFM